MLQVGRTIMMAVGRKKNYLILFWLKQNNTFFCVSSSQVKNEDLDFGWGVVLNFHKKMDQSSVSLTFQHMYNSFSMCHENIPVFLIFQ